jgi:hypothetical protein
MNTYNLDSNYYFNANVNINLLPLLSVILNYVIIPTPIQI